MEEQKLRCNFCDITFLSMPQLEYHYSDRQHKVNVMKRTQKLNAKSKKFRLPPDGVHMGQYKLCYRLEIAIVLFCIIICYNTVTVRSCV